MNPPNLKVFKSAKEYINQMPDKDLYHYTDIYGIKGIVESRSIWCTQFKFLNDSQEFVYALDIALNWINKKYPHHSFKQKVPGYKLETVTEILEYHSPQNWHEYFHNKLAQKISSGNEFISDLPIFLCSFTTLEDDLSQWRAYGKTGGYALKINKETLFNYVKDFDKPFILVKCIYKKDLQEKIIQSVLENIFSESQIPDNKKECDQLVHKKALEFFIGFLVIAAIVKHPSFEAENEWRLVSNLSYSIPPEVEHRISSNKVVPYSIFKFPENEPYLNCICTGPNIQHEAAIQGIKSLIGKYRVNNELLPEYEATKTSYQIH